MYSGNDRAKQSREGPRSRQSARLFLLVGIGTPPPPHPQATVSALPLVPGGGTHLLAGEVVGGGGGSQFRRGDTHCGTLGIYALCEHGTSLPISDPNVFIYQCLHIAVCTSSEKESGYL
jgi:hypothetical protein